MASPSTATPSKLEAQLTGKARQLEEDHAKGSSEAERLREEVNRTRAMRANRAANRSQKSISNMGGVTSPSSSSPLTSPPLGSSNVTSPSLASSAHEDHTTTSTAHAHTIHVDPNTKIKHHASSFPVFTGRVASPNPSSSTSTSSSSTRTGSAIQGGGGGTSLANFIGGDTRIKGPILNKVRPHEEESLLSTEERSTPQATFLARNPGLLPRHQIKDNGEGGAGVALPGMTRATPTPSSASTGSASFGIKTIEKSATDPTPWRSSAGAGKSPLLGPASNTANPSYDRTLSKSPAPMDKLSLNDDNDKKAVSPATDPKASAGTTASGSQIVSPKPVHSAFGSASMSNREAKTEDGNKAPGGAGPDDMTSLGRLRGASIVKQRLAWGEAQKEAGSKITPISSPKPASVASSSWKDSPKPASATSSSWSSSPKPASVSSNWDSTSSPKFASSISPILPKQEDEENITNKTPVQTKRSSVLDRWNRDTPSQTGASSTTASPTASPKPDNSASWKWPKPGYARPDMSKKPSWSSNSASMPASSPKLGTASAASIEGGNAKEVPNAEDKQAEQASAMKNEIDETPDAEKAVDDKPEVTVTEEPKSFQRPTTKPPWMKDTSIPSSPKTTEPTRASSFPKPQISTISTNNLSARSPLPASPKPTSSLSSRSMPSPSLPISVSPAPYVRSSTPQGSASSATSPRNSVFQPSATSFPVSLGVAPTHARPTSLAHFIGGDRHVNGPVLNKVRPEEFDGYGLENDATSPGVNKVGSFLTHNPNVMSEFMKKQRQQQQHRVPMPGMVRASPASPQPQQSPKAQSEPQSHAMEKKTSTGPLPLPGMESPKLPLPGEEASLPQKEAKEEQEEDKTMSKILKEGYQTVHSINTVQPSESSALLPGESTRPSARTISHEFEKYHLDSDSYTVPASTLQSQSSNIPSVSPASPGREDNPWAAIGSAMLRSGQDTIKEDKKKQHRSAPSWEGTLKTLGKGPARHAPRPPSRQESQDMPKTPKTPSDPVVARRPAIRKQELPTPDVSQLAMPSTSRIDFQQYVSVDVLSITDDSKTAAIPPNEQFIFYSTELLAVVLRCKQGGLVTTELLVWTGKHCSDDGREKVQELEKRYRATARYVEQGKESVQLVKALGGRLITRQGFRGTFDILNSTLYRVQSRGRGLSFIDEVDLQASSLGSAYSYIASVFQDLFVWYGRGTPDEESRVALQYADELARATAPGGAKRKVAHMLEGAESELWRDIMGHEEGYAFANHWRFRLDNPAVAQVATQFYEVNVSSDASHVRALGDETTCSLTDRGVYIVRTPLECFVLVTPSARGNSRKIAAALHAAAIILDKHPNANVPYRPTLHALVLPSLIPRDLQATLRSTVLEDLNTSYQPSTMNVIDEQAAWEHLGRDTFYKSEILHEALLPLGVAPEMLR